VEEHGQWPPGFPRNLRDPDVSIVNPDGETGTDNSLAPGGTPTTEGSKPRATRWYRPVKKRTGRDGRRGVGASHSIVEAGEPSRGTPWREGGSSVFKCKTSRIGPSGPWPSGGCARSSSRSLATPDSSPGSIGPTDSSLTSVHRYAW